MYQEIQKQVNQVLSASQHVPYPQTDKLMEQWANAKKRMIMAMNGLVYEHPEPVTFLLDESTRKRRFESFIEWIVNTSADEIADFLVENEEGFYDNKTIKEYHLWGRGENAIIPVGMKIGKALNKFFGPIYGENVVEPIRIEASRLIQENAVTGKLCISVHPLDYLSISENNHNWRSCHALDGEYRSGNLSYMLDECTVVAYLKSEEDAVLPRFPHYVPWNNKKWRCLLYFDFERHVVWAGRQYPFSCKSSLNIVEEYLLKPLHFFCDRRDVSLFYDWTHQTFKGEIKIGDMETYLKEPYIVYANGISPLREWIKDEEGSMQFNDLLNSSYYTPEMLQFGTNHCLRRHIEPMKVGRRVPCICCGEHDVEFSETMRCKQCTLESGIEMEEIGHCAYCDERIFLEMDYCHGDNYYCPTCYAEHIVTCHDCGDTFYAEDPSDYTDEKTGNIVCRYCQRHKPMSWL